MIHFSLCSSLFQHSHKMWFYIDLCVCEEGTCEGKSIWALKVIVWPWKETFALNTVIKKDFIGRIKVKEC